MTKSAVTADDLDKMLAAIRGSALLAIENGRRVTITSHRDSWPRSHDITKPAPQIEEWDVSRVLNIHITIDTGAGGTGGDR